MGINILSLITRPPTSSNVLLSATQIPIISHKGMRQLPDILLQIQASFPLRLEPTIQAPLTLRHILPIGPAVFRQPELTLGVLHLFIHSMRRGRNTQLRRNRCTGKVNSIPLDCPLTLPNRCHRIIPINRHPRPHLHTRLHLRHLDIRQALMGLLALPPTSPRTSST